MLLDNLYHMFEELRLQKNNAGNQVVETQTFFISTLGKRSNSTVAYFSTGLVQPTAR